MTETGRCRDCRYWTPDAPDDDWEGPGVCGFFGVHYFDPGDEHKRRYGLHLRYTPGIEYPEADRLPKNFMTAADFGCIQFEATP